ncbi:helix-turn-helix domain-containing protein [Kitasatospora sp. McL0602]|uniref:helix-turn-helix domain-containing protein n=1 Tax=Kitasatospora sp. McL0602 TaxID=3439530 RepID=UPI003F8BFFAD
MTTAADFVGVLRARKAVSGLSLRELQRSSGLPRSTIANMLDGKRASLPQWDRVLVLLRACGVSESDLPEWKAAWARILLDPVPEEPCGAGSTAEEEGTQVPQVSFEAAELTGDQEPDPVGGAAGSGVPRRFRVLTYLVVLAVGVAIGAAVVRATYEAEAPVTDSATTLPAATLPAPGAPGYVARVASVTGNAYATSTRLPVRRAVAAGDTLVVPIMLTNTHAGTVGATDSQGNTYTTAADQSDDAGDRVLVLTATAVRALSSSDTITVGYPSTGEQHLAVDELTNVKAVDQHAAATGAAGIDFDSGPTPTTTADSELIYGVAGVQGGPAATWSSRFTALPTLFVSHDQLATGYRTVSATGSYPATGTCAYQWMAAAVAFAPAAP